MVVKTQDVWPSWSEVRGFRGVGGGRCDLEQQGLPSSTVVTREGQVHGQSGLVPNSPGEEMESGPPQRTLGNRVGCGHFLERKIAGHETEGSKEDWGGPATEPSPGSAEAF